ncbi:DUF4280 domain-containing protein [Ferrimicrobium acidiphilum]|uniref:DUF4280 domain-containing protein n=1 Tax=Ferrimicrobium acidiphilum DSM 19497 TaxID=1121877 RepID=A0A0D8FTC5_9ACTN|nr:DUF4280 domain-containing protein [Ferrimicrobium acidiphilum]KJE75502.1 hypothetical protein FEAC_27420 [Ferrimicrobium acidiphilum DSM 19497]MCL5052427.1 DUF4280 domain-containing protein [Gammaproteobacteria bacterium]
MASPPVVSEATCMCSFGLAPAVIQIPPVTGVTIEGRPAATIMNSMIDNIPTFDMCSTLSNPEVAAATAAKLGVMTPMPCVPVLSPWIPVSTTLIGGQPALVAGSTCLCAYGGVVEITFPGTTGVVL